MRAGLLKHTINIYKPITTRTSLGSSNLSWCDICQTRARVIYESASRSVENSEVVFNNDVTFEIRLYWKTRVTEECKVLFLGKYYRILGIIQDEELQVLRIKTELINE